MDLPLAPPPATPALRVVACTTPQALDALGDDWRALEIAAGDALLPFQTHAWLRAWWRTFARHTPTRRDTLRILAFYDAHRLVAVLPLFETAVGIGPWPLLRYLRPLGADANLTELRTPLALPGYLPAVLEYALAAPPRSGTVPWVLQLVGPAAALEAVARHHRSRLQAGAGRPIRNYLLPLAADWDTFRSGLKRNIKESLRHCYNALRRAGLSHELVVIDEPAALRSHLPDFYRLHGLRAAMASASVKHPDYFAVPRHRAFLEAAIDGLQADGRRDVLLLGLRVGGTLVAWRLAFRCGRGLYLYYSGYDPAYARFSVMTTLLAETLRWCIGQGMTAVNLSIGTDVSKTRWGPAEVLYQETSFVPTTRLGGLSRRLLRVRRGTAAPRSAAA